MKTLDMKTLSPTSQDFRSAINSLIQDDNYSVLEITPAKAGRTLGWVVEIEDGKGGFQLFVRETSDETPFRRITRYVNDFIEAVS